MFNYKGLSEEQILALCKEDNVDRGKSTWKYWTSEVYSFGKHYRNYGFYPEKKPLLVYSEHAVDNPNVGLNEIENDANAMLVFSKEKYDKYKKISNKPCYIITNPMVWYRKSNNIAQTGNAIGTLAFPVHSTPKTETIFDIKSYITDLKKMPENMQPVCACLHMHDINNGQYKIFLDNNIPVYTAGNAYDIKFAQRFYNILKNFKFACSNTIGSYAYYSVEMGIPFSLFGKTPKYINIDDPNLPEGEYKIEEMDYYIKFCNLFNGIHTSITKEQQEHVMNRCCSPYGISRLKLFQILWTSYLKYKISKIFKQ